MTDVSDSPVAYGGSIASRVEETMRSVLPIGGVKQKVLAVFTEQGCVRSSSRSALPMTWTTYRKSFATR